MSPEGAEDDAIQFLREHGFVVNRIPVSKDERRADLEASIQGDTYLIEVHARNGDQDYFSALRNKGEAELENRIEFQQRLADIIHDKNKQLRSTPSAPHAFRILWIACVGADTSVQARQIVATWLGAVDVYTSSGSATPCYFFDFASCFRMRHIDGIVIRVGPSGLFVPNPVSGLRAALIGSALGKVFRDAAKILIPEADEASGGALLANDFPGDRQADVNDRARELFLREKYQLQVAYSLRWTHYRAA